MPQENETDTSSHSTGVSKGEEKSQEEGKESGRQDKEETGANRPAGTSTASNSTSINPEDREPIDPKSPNLPPA